MTPIKNQLAFSSWSGGKDSALALYKAIKEHSLRVSHCLNMVNEDGQYGRSHGVRSGILQAQVEAMGFTILQQPASWENYEENFKAAGAVLKEKGITVGIFGDIDLEPHRQWVERVCAEIGFTPILPLWLGDREKLMADFLEAGFQAVVTAVNSEVMGPEWLGRLIDEKFLADLRDHKNIDLCGEKGEYHTLVLDGPFFKKSINILDSQPTKIENHWFLNITGFELVEHKNREDHEYRRD